jgi:protein-S-isoprenylcysteine O-methyltransferase Ste14
MRNPMYLGHIIFFVGLALVLQSWIAAGGAGLPPVWFDLRARSDEKHLAQRFGEPYRDYCKRVKRWIPFVY